MKAIRRTILSGHSIGIGQDSARYGIHSIIARQCVAGCLALLVASASGCGVYRASLPFPVTPFLLAEALEIDETLCSKTFASEAVITEMVLSEAVLSEATIADVEADAVAMSSNHVAMEVSAPFLLPASGSDVQVRTVCYGAGPDDFSLASRFRQAQEAFFTEANSVAPSDWDCENETPADPSLRCAAWGDDWLELTSATSGAIVSHVPFLTSMAEADAGDRSLEMVELIESLEVSTATENSSDASFDRLEESYVSRAQLMRTLLDVDQSSDGTGMFSSPLGRFWQSHLSGLEILIEVSAEQDMSKVRENATEAKRELIRSLDDLGGVCDLQLRNACFADSIRCFGSYTEFEDARFEPGRQGVYFYVEAENLTFEAAKGLVEVKTSSYYEIVNSDGDVVVRVDSPVSEQYYSVPRHEYFFSYEVEIPEDLSEGDYVLSLTLTDLNGTKSTATELGFSVVSP